MSVYSGFCTRKQEKDYNFCLQKMMFILAKRCVKAIHNVPVDATRFAAYFGKIFGMMIRLEEGKYQPPKLSDALYELADALGIRDLDMQQSDNQSQMMESSSYFNNKAGNNSGRQPVEVVAKRNISVDPEKMYIQSASRLRPTVNKSQDIQENPNQQRENDNSNQANGAKSYVVNYKYYYNQSPPKGPATVQQPKKISPQKLDNIANNLHSKQITKIQYGPSANFNQEAMPSHNMSDINQNHNNQNNYQNQRTNNTIQHNGANNNNTHYNYDQNNNNQNINNHQKFSNSNIDQTNNRSFNNGNNQNNNNINNYNNQSKNNNNMNQNDTHSRNQSNSYYEQNNVTHNNQHNNGNQQKNYRNNNSNDIDDNNNNSSDNHNQNNNSFYNNEGNSYTNNINHTHLNNNNINQSNNNHNINNYNQKKNQNNQNNSNYIQLKNQNNITSNNANQNYNNQIRNNANVGRNPNSTSNPSNIRKYQNSNQDNNNPQFANQLPMDPDFDDKVQISQMGINQTQNNSTNQKFDGRSVKDREQDFLRKFDQSQINKDDNQMFPIQQPQRRTVGIGQNVQTSVFENPENDIDDENNMFDS